MYFGRGAYGIQAAAQAYFGVDVSALTLNQSASLAAIIKAPSVYAPHINPSSNRSRRQYILSVMEDNGFITQEEAREARGESVWVLAREAEKQSYGWYIDEALREGAELLGLSALDRSDSRRFEIHTAYDARLQTGHGRGLFGSNLPCRRIRRNADQSAMAAGGYRQRHGLPNAVAGAITVQRRVKPCDANAPSGVSALNRWPFTALRPTVLYDRLRFAG
ncbi:MAG: transglycosylase domain-containing protein [Christensenellales bacterium]